MPLWMWIFLVGLTVWFGVRISEAPRGKQTVGVAVLQRSENAAMFWVASIVHGSFFVFCLSLLVVAVLKQLGAF
jgi:hypothetical protein